MDSLQLIVDHALRYKIKWKILRKKNPRQSQSQKVREDETLNYGKCKMISNMKQKSEKKEEKNTHTHSSKQQTT